MFPADLPKVTSVEPFIDNPLSAFAKARHQLGDIFLLTEGRPLFSGIENCTGCVAVFGKGNTRGVLTDLENYGMPRPLARQHSFPTTMEKLNSGLFSMTGDEHQAHQKVLADVLSKKAVLPYAETILQGCHAYIDTLKNGATISLLEEMRRLTLEVSSRVIFGGPTSHALEVGQLVQQYFALRREHTTDAHPTGGQRNRLVQLGDQIHHRLSQHVKNQRSSDVSDESVLARLCRSKLPVTNGCYAAGAKQMSEPLSEQQLVTHANVLFMSGSEPTAVTLTWIMLILSQCGAMRSGLRRQFNQIEVNREFLQAGKWNECRLLNGVINETMRLLPPNAIMTRVTQNVVELAGKGLPERCEVLLFPYFSHRDATCFERPEEFSTDRWRHINPGPFEFMPYGNGRRYCMGREVAAMTLKIAMTLLLRRFDWVLAEDQEIDWNINVNLMPATEIRMRLSKNTKDVGGKLTGPVSGLFKFDV